MVEAAQKFPDPLDQSPPVVTADQEVALEKESKVGRRKFLRTLIIILLILPFLTAIVIFAYQTYLDFTLRKEAEHQPEPKINKEAVVTVEPLPEASSSAVLPSGWKQYVNFKDQYSFGYPGDWFVVATAEGDLRVQNTDPATAPEQTFDPLKDPGKQQIVFTFLASAQRFSQPTQLESYLKNVDAEQTQKPTIVSTTNVTTDTGLVAVRRLINRPRSTLQFAQAFVSVDKGVLQIDQSGDTTVQAEVFDQLLKTVSVVSDPQNPVNQTWKELKHTGGFSLRYPDTVTATSDSELATAQKIEFKPSGNVSTDNSLLVEIFESEPGQTGTQSATKDFGDREFKVIEQKNLTRYFGQLATGKWLQITLSYDSNIDIRKLLNQIIDTIEPDQPTQLP